MGDPYTGDDETVETVIDAPVRAPSLAHAIGARNLMIIIITMPLVFLIVVMAVISIFGRPGDNNDPRLAPVASATGLETLSQPLGGVTTPSAVAYAISPAPLVVPEGASISSMALDGDRLVMRVEGVGDGEIIIYDLARGAVVQRIPVMAQLASDADL